MRSRRCIWCRQEQDVCPEGDHADLGRWPWWPWRYYYRYAGRLADWRWSRRHR